MEHEYLGAYAELGIDGNCGFALLGENIQEGECEFVEIFAFDEHDDAGYNGRRLAAKTSTCREAFRRLSERLQTTELRWYFGRSHPYGGN